MLSNSDTVYTRDLHKSFRVHTVQAKRSVNTNAKHRGNVDELLVTNY